jgi:eukaryotic-like serine/threonine-protein kinase
MQMAAVAFRGTNRFRLVRLLGRGGMGVVYEAFDEVNGSPVALKVLPVASPDLLLRFKHEFRTIADVRHPNLVRLGELVSEGEQWFITMELVRGIDLVSYVRGGDARQPFLARPTTAWLDGGGVTTLPAAPPPALGLGTAVGYEEERLRPVFAQLAQALAALHAAGCVHRDVKPSNVIVTPEGRAVLLDFGLASTTNGESALLGAGTPEYMAPEQVTESTVGAGADWYAMGAILFQVLAGRLPFEGLRHEILYRKTHERAPPASLWAPGAPADLVTLCDGLLERQPGARLSGAAALAALGSGPAASPPPSPASEGPAPFVGRDAELAALADALAAVRGGDGGRALIVRGESGVGKSTLVRCFVEANVTSENAVLLTARCYERELVPYKAVDGLVDALAQVLRRLDPAFIEAHLPRQASILLQAFPVLGRIEAIARAPHEVRGGDAREIRASMFAAFRELLGVLAIKQPIVAVIDDLQWADADSLALLAELLRPPLAPRLMLLGTLRTPAAVHDPAERLLGAGVPEEHLAVRNLNQEAARALARELLGPHAPARARHWAELLARESGGHPLFLRELARTVHLRTGEDFGLTLDGVLGARIDSLSDSARRVLRALAVAGAPTAGRILSRVLGGVGGATLGALDELRAAKVIHSASDRGDELVDIVHDRIRQVVRASTSPLETHDLHEHLAEAFEDAGETLRAAGHWREAGHRHRAALHFADAGKSAADALAFDRAIAHFEAALDLGAWQADRQRDLRVGLADALANAGRGTAAAPHYLVAAETAGPVHALELRRRGAEELLRSGSLDEGRSVAARALADAGLRFSRAPLRELLWQRAILRIRGQGFRPRVPEEIAPRDLARVDLCWSLSSGLGLMDPVQGAHFQVRSLLLALRAGERYRVTRGIAGEAAYAAAQGHARRSRRLLTEAARMADQVGKPHANGIVSLMSGLADHLLGNFTGGLEHLEAASRTFRERCVGTAWELNAARHFALECLYYLGDLERFQSSAAEGLREANDRGSVYAATTLRTGVGNAVWLIKDDPQRARHEVTEAMGAWSSSGYHVQHWYELIAHTQIDLYLGDGAAALARVERVWPALRRSHLLQLKHTRLVALHLRGRAALAAAAAAAPGSAARAQGLRLARGCARRLGHKSEGWGSLLAALLQAGGASLQGDGEGAARWLRRAIEDAGRHGLLLFKAAAQVAAADALSDSQAGAAGTRWMRERGAPAPERLARMLVPGTLTAARSTGVTAPAGAR